MDSKCESYDPPWSSARLCMLRSKTLFRSVCSPNCTIFHLNMTLELRKQWHSPWAERAETFAHHQWFVGWFWQLAICSAPLLTKPSRESLNRTLKSVREIWIVKKSTRKHNEGNRWNISDKNPSPLKTAIFRKKMSIHYFTWASRSQASEV